jgi:hypothetical protein
MWMSMNSDGKADRSRLTAGDGLRVLLVVGALLSGCYYRGCACDHRRGGWGDHGHDRGRDFDRGRDHDHGRR